ncbi:MAG TPA: penicillin acylase family protein [Bryobacteraceae bacterium]|jgi:penicillin amidase|nr:penicillin acylase family protein [Bryobacteraceae bacterium]
MPSLARCAAIFCTLCFSLSVRPQQTPIPTRQLRVSGLKDSVEVLRDHWGVPHIYAKNTGDLFFVQGYITAQDRLFQLDLWRRIGTGKLAEVLGPRYLNRDRIARLVRFRGNWDQEWRSYSPDAKEIATAFTSGINAYIRSLHGRRPKEFQLAGFDPGHWAPEDVTARVAGLLMTGNLLAEVNRTLDVKQLGLAADARLFPPEPAIPLQLPKGLDVADITPAIVKDYVAAIGAIHFPGEQGSNNWVVDGTMTRTGEPILANDPHRGIELPSLRKTVHLVAPGWDVIGAGEPALPGIALGHNENIAWGFTIVGIDQQDLYVETVNPADPTQYLYQGEWKKFELEQQSVLIKSEGPHNVELKYSVHGPVIYEDDARHRAYALRWVGTAAGGAGYLPALQLARSSNWTEFRAAVANYKIPSENLVYADRQGNIGWIAAGQAPIRKGWPGLFPVPGDSGKYEWSGFLPATENPTTYNPARHFVATANHDILPPGYSHVLGYAWAPPSRYQRIVEMLTTGKKFDVDDFARMQQDTVSLPARDFQALLKAWHPAEASEAAAVRAALLIWDCDVTMNSKPALLYEVWIEHLHSAVLPKGIASARLAPDVLLAEVKASPERDQLLNKTLQSSLAEIQQRLGPDKTKWKWGNVHNAYFDHQLGVASLDLPAHSRPGDAYTVNATGGANYAQTHGASYRQVLDVSDWDRSLMTNVPGESGNPGDPHYGDLIEGWAEGHYHPMPFSRKAVDAAAEERLLLVPADNR